MAVLAEQPPYDDEEHRHEEDREQGGGDHAAHHAGADRVPARRSRARTDDERQHAEHEGKRGHQDRSQAQARGFERGVDQAVALRLQVLGEFDDQDRVLG